MLWCFLFIQSCVVGFYMNNDEWRLVKTPQGPIRGRKEAGVYVFYNIPYATVPTGANKYKAPLPPPNWVKTVDAIDEGIICPQAKIHEGTSELEIQLLNYYGVDSINTKNMQEDCLITNVYVPDTDNKNLSVVVYIHDGAFQVGFGDWQKAKTMAKSKEIITVNFNYRLGVQGFLCLGNKDAPGNAGMKDIVAMLRWLKTSIASFGGNPDDVTVSGYGTGAVAADLLILSNSARGLFHKVIIESGSSLSEVAVQTDPMENAKLYAKSWNFSNADDMYDLTRFYKAASYDKLLNLNYLTKKDASFLFVPCVERDIGEAEAFLDDSPINILKYKNYTKVPMLYGFNQMDGLIRLPFFNLWKSAMNEKFSDFLPNNLKFENKDEKEMIAKVIERFYFKKKPVDDYSILSYVDYFTDVIFAYPALRSMRLNIEGGNHNIYLYYYSFVDKYDPYIPHTNVRGATYCAQSKAIFDDLKPKNTSIDYTNIRQMMRTVWANFIKTGKPSSPERPIRFYYYVVDWPPTDVSGIPHMSLGRIMEQNGALLEEKVRFWDNIYQEYYKEPVSPPNTIDEDLSYLSMSVEYINRKKKFVRYSPKPYKMDELSL